MSKTLSVVAVSGSLHSPSKTGLLLEAIFAELHSQLGVSTSTVEAYSVGVVPGVFPPGQPESVRAALDSVLVADLLVVAGPVYGGSYTGAFKQFFELVGQNAIVGKPVLLAATGGDLSHSLVIDQQLRPLFGFYRALGLPAGIYAKDQDYTDGRISSDALLESIRSAVEIALPYIRAGARSAD